MTQTPPDQQSAQNHDLTQEEGHSHDPSASLRPRPETTSDNDVNEKPVREKLKKTSIASISQHTMKTQGSGQMADDNRTSDVEVAQAEAPTDKGASKAGLDLSRGRPLKKRSFDGLEIIDTYEDIIVNDRTHSERRNGHVRKRSRDVRTGEILKGDRSSHGMDTTLEEDTEDSTNQAESPQPTGHDSKREETTAVQESVNHQKMEVEHVADHQTVGASDWGPSMEIGKTTTDHEMRDLAPSPRKKRSRDQFDTEEADREPKQKQKVPATEESRAQRKSDEMKRTESKRSSSESELLREVPTPLEQDSIPATESKKVGTVAAKIAPSAPFGNTSVLSRPTGIANSASPREHSPDIHAQTSAAAFASSGFAALASSATSPFGTLGASSTSATTPSPFALETTISSKNFEPTATGTKNTEPAGNGGFGAFAKSTSSGFGTSEPSSLGPTGAAKNGVFGGSVFGGGFGGGLGGGRKLTNFAAPTGDAKLGTPNGAVKPIASPDHQGDEEADSEDEGEGLAEDDQGGADEVDARFQHKDVETGEDDEVTIFSSRASLYTFKDRAWKEGGKGGFKLNVRSSDGDQGPKSARFIMRAQQTFRVLLNAPVMKGMTVGDRGKEPSGKSFQFAAIEDGKIVPHLLKLGEADSKALYHAVIELQQSMSED